MTKVTILKGNLGRDAELKKTRTNEDVLSFPVGTSQGHGDRKKTIWYRCAVWGKRAVSLAPYLTKGTMVGITGELEIDEYEGKTQHKIAVDPNGVEILSRPENAQRQPTAHDRAKANGYQPDNLDDLDTPF